MIKLKPSGPYHAIGNLYNAKELPQKKLDAIPYKIPFSNAFEFCISALLKYNKNKPTVLKIKAIK